MKQEIKISETERKQAYANDCFNNFFLKCLLLYAVRLRNGVCIFAIWSAKVFEVMDALEDGANAIDVIEKITQQVPWKKVTST